MTAFEKIVLVVRKTRLEELVERFGTRGQARFYLQQSSGDFAAYQDEDEAQRRSLDALRRQLDLGLKLQQVDRQLVPTFVFAPTDLVVTLGQDGLVANTAKYVGAQPIVAINPDPARFDGVLLPFTPAEARGAVGRVLDGSARVREVTLAEALLGDGQRLLGFNDLYIGAQSHVSARYRIRWAGADEPHSSSGVLVSTGAGSTGWLSSVFNMMAGIAAACGGQAARPVRMEWEDPRLMFVVREPFKSRHSAVQVVAGHVERGQELVLESQMPAGGVIFSDGIQEDFLAFNSGAIARIRAAAQKARLCVG
jgi:NAD kinase